MCAWLSDGAGSISGDNPIGETIWVDRTRCEVIGVMTELESTDVQERYRSDPNEGLLMPISTVIQTLYEEEPRSIWSLMSGMPTGLRKRRNRYQLSARAARDREGCRRKLPGRFRHDHAQ